MKPILFIANNPGGFRALYPVYLALKAQATLLITEGLKPLAGQGHDFILPYDLDAPGVGALLKEHAPRLIVTGTSVASSKGGHLENTFIRCAQDFGIKTLSILDHWCHYVERFSLESPLDSLPDAVAVMDVKALHEMTALGFDPARVKITGQPAFDTLLEDASKRDVLLKNRARNLSLAQDTELITFVSEPVCEDYGVSRGYDQHEALKDILEALKNSRPKAHLALKTHPRESPEPFQCLLRANAACFLSPSGLSPRDLVLSSDLVIGMTSILLIESALMGVATFSYQPGIAQNSTYAAMMAPLPVVTSREQLAAQLSSGQKSLIFPYRETRATQRVIDLIRTLF